MLESPRAIIHFVGGETLAVPPSQAELLAAAIPGGELTPLQVGTRATWVNPRLITYIQMPSVAQASGDAGPGASYEGLHAVPRLRVG